MKSNPGKPRRLLAVAVRKPIFSDMPQFKLKYQLLILLLITSAGFAQFRTDFLISDTTFVSDMSIDPDGDIHTIEWNEKGIYYGLYDSIGYLLSNRLRISDSYWKSNLNISVSLKHVLFLWRQVTPAFDYIEGKILYRDTDSLSAVLGIDASSGCWIPYGCSITDTSFIVLWAGEDQIYGRILSTNTDVTNPAFQVSENLDVGYRCGGTVVINIPSKQQFLALWHNYFSDENKISGRFMNYDGSPFDSVFIVSDDSSVTELWFFDAELISDNKVGIVWAAEIDSQWCIQRRCLNSEGIFIGHAQTIPDLNFRPVELATVNIEVTGSGRIILLYEGEYSVDSVRICAKRFDGDFNPISTESIVTYMPDSDIHSIICNASRNEKIYVIWYPDSWASIFSFDNPPNSIFPENQINFHTPILLQNYPNPFNSETMINLIIYEQAEIKLNLYNVLGQKLRTIFSGTVGQGHHKFIIRDSNLSTGIYFYKLESSEIQLTKKCILIK